MPVVVTAYVPDLMDRSRFGSLGASVDVVFVTRPQDLDRDAEVAVADIGRDGALEALAALPAEMRRVGFVSHVDDTRRQEAADVGVEAIPRSRFFSRLVTLLTHSDGTELTS